MNFCAGTSTPMSLTSKPLMSSMKVTMFLPMSCRSPCTVPISTLPSLAAAVPPLSLISGLAMAPTVSSISPASTSSGRKYSPSSKRLPTISIAARHRPSTCIGSTLSCSNMRLASGSASSSFMSASHSTSWRSSSVQSFMGSSPWGVNSRDLPGRRGTQGGLDDDLRERLFVLVAHQVYAGHAFDLAHRMDGLDTDATAFAPLVGGGADARSDRLGHVHARHMFGHPAQGLGAPERAHADDDRRALMQAACADLAHEGFEQLQVKAELRLDELRAGVDLALQIGHALSIGWHERVRRGAEKQPRRQLQPPPRGVLAAVAHTAQDVQQVDGIEVEHRLGLGMVALAHVVASQAQHVSYAQGGSTENIALHRDTVAIAATHLAYRREVRGGKHRRGGHARHVAVGAGAVGDVDGIHQPGEEARALQQRRRVGRVGRCDLHRDNEASLPAGAFERAARPMGPDRRCRLRRWRRRWLGHDGAHPARVAVA